MHTSSYVTLDEALDDTFGRERVVFELNLTVDDECVGLNEDFPGLYSSQSWIKSTTG